MKLRNKKTGEIVDVESLGHAESLKKKNGYQVTLSWPTKCKNLSQCKSYTSLAQINEEWEDYKPADPLIKDEKIRKAVRAWAKALGRVKTFVVSYNVEYHDCCIYTSGLSDTAMIDLGIDLNVREGCYAIEELCGEEE